MRKCDRHKCAFLWWDPDPAYRRRRRHRGCTGAGCDASMPGVFPWVPTNPRPNWHLSRSRPSQRTIVTNRPELSMGWVDPWVGFGWAGPVSSWEDCKPPKIYRITDLGWIGSHKMDPCHGQLCNRRTDMQRLQVFYGLIFKFVICILLHFAADEGKKLSK